MKLVTTVVFSALAVLAAMQEDGGTMILDDFSDGDAMSAVGTQWSFFTDGVMGGRSQGSAGLVSDEGSNVLKLSGDVSLENNGGFIQTALPLVEEGNRWLDASSYQGVRLRVRGNGETYYIHLRTPQTRLPWMYFAAEFTADTAYQEIDIPFSAFTFENGSGRLDTGRLTRIAVVAAKKAFSAEVYVDYLALYK